MLKSFTTHRQKVDGKEYLVAVYDGHMHILQEMCSAEYWAMAYDEDQLKKLVKNNYILLNS